MGYNINLKKEREKMEMCVAMSTSHPAMKRDKN